MVYRTLYVQEETMPKPANARIEVRVSPAVKARIEYAARLDDTTVSDFMLAAAKERAEDVVRQHHTHTLVPADFFDSLVEALDEPVEANDALTNAIRKSHSRTRQY
jgi:uncharacterized protein (DUF1778 family)